MNLTGSIAVVAGATGGLGREIARELLAAGADVRVLVRDVRKLDPQLAGCRAAECEITDVRAMRAALGSLVDVGEKLSVVVNATGVVAFGPLDETSDETIEWLTMVNYTAAVQLIREALPLMASPGAIVTISGVVAESPVANMAAYSASKSALHAATIAIGREVRRRGITILDARPPHTETGLAAHPISGDAPTFPQGLVPAAVAARIVRAIVDDERDIPSSAF
ncbi:MAG: SDR family NAD(P)-dependent oxidoreductase [Ilumatobacteraceae bacterium]